MIYETIYKRLEKLGVIKLFNSNVASAKSKSGGFMDLNYDRIARDVIALSHYYRDERSGDMIADPDMAIRIIPDAKMAEALTYQDSFGFKVVYVGDKVNAALKKDLNSFLAYWLLNAKKQGHRF